MKNRNDFLSGLLEGNWSPQTRLLMGLAGGGLVIYGLTQRAPVACILGTLGLGLVAESAFNVGVKDLMPSSGREQPRAVGGNGGLSGDPGQARRPRGQSTAMPAALNRM